MTTSQRVIKNTGYLYARMCITMFISLYATRLVLNSLGVSDFGIFNIVGGAITMLGFLNVAMASATQRFMSFAEGEGNLEKKNSIFNISIKLHLIVALIAGIVLLISGYFFFNGILNIPTNRIFAAKIVYQSLVTSTLFTILTVPYDAIINAHENMRYYAIVGVLESLLKLTVAFVTVYTSSDKLIIYGILMACIPFITLSVMRVYCHHHYEECQISLKKKYDKNIAKEMVGFAGWNLVNSVIIIVSIQGQSIILNHFFGTLLNAAQAIAVQINGQMQALSNNMMKALNPVFGKSAGAHNQELLIRSAIYGSKYSAALYLIVALPMFIEAPYILKLWLKEIPEWTVIFVRFQLFKTLIEVLFNTVPGIINASGRIKQYYFYSCLFNSLQLPAIYIVFKYGGQPYSMYIFSIIFGNIFVYAAALYWAKKNCNLPVKLYFRTVIFPLLFATLIAVLILYSYIFYIEINSIVSLAVYLLFSLLSFSSIFYLLGCTLEEKETLNALVKKLIRRLNLK